jgi:erythromycin esterase-like protein
MARPKNSATVEANALPEVIALHCHPLERADTERISHYFEARLPEQFDAIIHLDRTRAVEPLERTAGWEGGEPPETFPTAV